MASRKTLKKHVKMIAGELFADCVALSMCQQADPEKLDELMAEVLVLHNEFVARISHTDKCKAKAYYKHFKAEFTEQVNALSDRIIKC